jgi:hypothetical protein
MKKTAMKFSTTRIVWSNIIYAFFFFFFFPLKDIGGIYRLQDYRVNISFDIREKKKN